MEPDHARQALVVETQPEVGCRLCLPKGSTRAQSRETATDPRLRGRTRAHGTELNTFAAPLECRKPSKPRSSDNATKDGRTIPADATGASEVGTSPPHQRDDPDMSQKRRDACNEIAIKDPRSSLPNATETSNLDKTAPSINNTSSTDPDAMNPPITQKQLPDDRNLAQKSMELLPRTGSNADIVPMREKARRKAADLCVMCGEQPHGWCYRGWTYRPHDASSSAVPESNVGPYKRPASQDGGSGESNKRGRGAH